MTPMSPRGDEEVRDTLHDEQREDVEHEDDHHLAQRPSETERSGKSMEKNKRKL